MSRDFIPFFLHEAVISLYPAAADGSSLTGAAIWSGALANQLRARWALDELKIMGSGDSYTTAHHIDEETILDIARTWILPRAALADFFPQRNQQYVLEAVWSAAGVWYKRTFFGVTGRVVNHESLGTNQFIVNQTFRAQYFQESNGTTGPAIYTPTPQPGQAVGFFREDPFVNGQYLLGNYVWPDNVALTTVLVTGLAGQGAPTVLTLELGGVLTDMTLTIPAGVANTEVEASANFSGYIISAGATVRWQITSGPIPENAMWVTSLTMQVVPQ